MSINTFHIHSADGWSHNTALQFIESKNEPYCHNRPCATSTKCTISLPCRDWHKTQKLVKNCFYYQSSNFPSSFCSNCLCSRQTTEGWTAEAICIRTVKQWTLKQWTGPGSRKVGVAQSPIYVIVHSLLEVSFCTQPFPTPSGGLW